MLAGVPPLLEELGEAPGGALVAEAARAFVRWARGRAGRRGRRAGR
ncbi:hypothetical protein SLNWT_0106 [Streptomyces albus]|uniref:Uncharacterized protein n=1 Tax=Streptomyces albus (strain ATCC 21838 / DSM 41398 / FERM P-419 / JCM 4703 / NBRC 107858) TaxID=1081613 RepID=A0A0B5EQP7_STRA4|nr:hypothetical protein SLNWT_0106 [Streptomyces albus]AOU74797.1 hypothetical protein SLNHY_0106 [Streptomyces albus]